MAGPQRERRQPRQQEEAKSEFQERVINVNRCAKVVKGGRRFSFNAIVALGDQNGRVGVGLGKANEVADAIRKGGRSGEEEHVPCPGHKERLDPAPDPRPLRRGQRAAWPASPGTGVIAGGGVRAVPRWRVSSNVLTKCLGTRNPHNPSRRPWTASSVCAVPRTWRPCAARRWRSCSERVRPMARKLRITQTKSALWSPEGSGAHRSVPRHPQDAAHGRTQTTRPRSGVWFKVRHR